MTWRAMGLAHVARHVIGCHVTQEARVKHAPDDVAVLGNASDDVAGNIRVSLVLDSHGVLFHVLRAIAVVQRPDTTHGLRVPRSTMTAVAAATSRTAATMVRGSLRTST